MDKEKIKEELIMQKNAKLLDMMEIAGKFYAKTLVILNEENLKFEYKYYEIEKENINELEEEKINEIKKFFETNLGDVLY